MAKGSTLMGCILITSKRKRQKAPNIWLEADLAGFSAKKGFCHLGESPDPEK
jgi:hypothetical protein